MASQENLVDLGANSATKKVPWNPWLGVGYVLAIYVFSQVVGLSIIVYPWLRHWSSAASSAWVNNSIYAQFFYVLIVEGFSVLAVLKLLKIYKVKPNIIGLRRPKLSDGLYGLAAVPIYYILYLVAVGSISYFYKGLNVKQQQNIGFSGAHGVAELVITFISLVILPPIAEEILVRGFLYGSLKKGMPTFAAAIVTSVIFASAHLPEGAGGLLWIGFIDTFILSIVLVFIREKTDGLWAGMTLHGLKNGVAYVVLYITPLVQFHYFKF